MASICALSVSIGIENPSLKLMDGQSKLFAEHSGHTTSFAAGRRRPAGQTDPSHRLDPLATIAVQNLHVMAQSAAAHEVGAGPSPPSEDMAKRNEGKVNALRRRLLAD